MQPPRLALAGPLLGVLDEPAAIGVFAGISQHLLCFEAVRAFSAEIAILPLAVHRFRQHECQGLLPHALRTGKKKRAGHPVAGRHSEYQRFRARVAQK